MHVLHVITHLGLGGAERVAEVIAVGLIDRGIEAAIFAVAASDEARMVGTLRDSLASGGVAVAVGSGSRNRKLAVLRAVRPLVRTVGHARPDLVHLHTEVPELTWALATVASRAVRATPVVRTIHNTRLWSGWGVVGRLTEGRLDGARIVGVSEAALSELGRWRAGRPGPAAAGTVIYNGVPPIARTGVVDRPGSPLRLLFAGRLEYQKGIDVLIEALGMVGVGPERMQVEILGTGRQEALVGSAAAADPERLRWGMPRPDLRDHLVDYDAILMPSRFEGLAILALEALCAGVPVLATDAPGLSEALPADYPGRCAPGDPGAFASLIRSFVESPEPFRAAAAGARTWALERYSVDSMLDGYESVYRSVVASAAGVARK